MLLSRCSPAFAVRSARPINGNLASVVARRASQSTQRARPTCRRADPSDAVPEVPQDTEGMMEPQEDAEVPGGYLEALNGNTKLGKAVRAACDELEHLNNMELDMLQQAEGLLKKLGVKQPLIVHEEKADQAEVEL